MEQLELYTPHLTELGRRVPVFPAIRKRKKAVANIWFFDSPKNEKRQIISGDLAFMTFVLLEGDQSVRSYDPRPGPVSISYEGVTKEVSAGGYVYYKDGGTEWLDFQYRNNPKKLSDESRLLGPLAAKERGMQYQLRTKNDVRNKAVLFDNWLNLCAGISRCRSVLLFKELDFILDATNETQTTVGKLLEAGMDRACMFAAIGISLQRGSVCTDLERVLLGNDSVLKRRSA
jgi:hypothetical protein